jgi:hypothetical protein
MVKRFCRVTDDRNRRNLDEFLLAKGRQDQTFAFGLGRILYGHSACRADNPRTANWESQRLALADEK